MRTGIALILLALLLAGCQRPMQAVIVEGSVYADPEPVARPPPRDASAPPLAAPPAALANRAPTAPFFAPGTDGAHHVPNVHAFWWALADDLDGDTLLYTIATRVDDKEPIVQCAKLLFPPCELHLETGRAHVVTVTASDGRATSSASVTLTARNPILLLPDLDGNGTRWKVVAARLAEDGFVVLDFRGLTNDTLLHLAPGPYESLARFAVDRVAPLVQTSLAGSAYPAGQRIDVIALGIGGLVARILNEEQGWMEANVYVDAWWNDAIDHVILVGAPHLGADMACDTRACEDAAPNSTLLRRLAVADPPEATWTVSLDADPQIGRSAMLMHRTPDTRVEGAGRDEAPYRDEVYDAILRALALRRGR